jgi:hypothetical protein
LGPQLASRRESALTKEERRLLSRQRETGSYWFAGVGKQVGTILPEGFQVLKLLKQQEDGIEEKTKSPGVSLPSVLLLWSLFHSSPPPAREFILPILKGEMLISFSSVSSSC